jgi:hypothetical protein
MWIKRNFAPALYVTKYSFYRFRLSHISKSCRWLTSPLIFGRHQCFGRRSIIVLWVLFRASQSFLMVILKKKGGNLDPSATRSGERGFRPSRLPELDHLGAAFHGTTPLTESDR